MSRSIYSSPCTDPRTQPRASSYSCWRALCGWNSCRIAWSTRKTDDCTRWVRLITRVGQYTAVAIIVTVLNLPFLEIDGVDPKDLVTYPNNLTIKSILYSPIYISTLNSIYWVFVPLTFDTCQDLSYFIAAPTLCYQMNYPRSKSIRWYWLTGKFLQFVRATM